MMDREQKIINNMGLVHYVLHKYFPLYIDNQDNIQNGYVGLIKAVDSFDESTGNTFSTYATRCIFNEIAMDLRRRNKYAKDISLHAVLANIYHQRQHHKQDEWRVTFCDWIKTLPYFEFITGEFEEESK